MKSCYDFYEEMMANNVSGGQIAGTVGDPPVRNKKPPVIARGLMPKGRTKFKKGADLLASFKKNKYT